MQDCIGLEWFLLLTFLFCGRHEDTIDDYFNYTLILFEWKLNYGIRNNS